MSASLLMLAALAVLGCAYVLYGRYLVRRFDIDPSRATPANTRRDGVDFVPARLPVLFGHHFSSIAGAGPILGPIYAAVFGWVPVFLWILVGSVFLGGVHDMSALVASIRHGGKSIGEVIEEHIGRAGKRLFLIFTWFMLVLVIAVFCKAIGSVFVKEPGTVTSSALFIGLALLFGISVYRLKVPLAWASLAGAALLFAGIFAGTRLPIVQPMTVWMIVLFVYASIAAVVPVWLLLQPRDYLNSFLLFALLLGGVAGILVANPTIVFPAVTRFRTDIGYLFPILFVTVACGAISGFHSLVSGGTTSKQLASEAHARPVGYGGMLVEAVLAVVAMITAVTILEGDYGHLITTEGGGPIGIFSSGVGGFLSRLGIPGDAAVTFAALAISAFALTTMDTATRIGRFAFQELFEGVPGFAWLARNRYIGTLITVGCAALLAFSGTGSALWPLFGSANQLLAALALLAVTAWLTSMKKPVRFVRIPMMFMAAVTLAALMNLIYKNWIAGNALLLIIGLLLFAVAVVLFYQAVGRLRRRT